MTGLPPVHPVIHRDRRGFAALAAQVEAASIVALDIETVGLDPILGRPRLLQLGLPCRAIHVVDLFATGGLGRLGNALARTRLLGHNLKFDLSFLAHHYGVRVEGIIDTMLASRVADASVHRGVKGFHRLEAVCDRHLGFRLPKEHQASDWSGLLTTAQIEYAARDVAVLPMLWRRLKPLLVAEGLLAVAELEFALVPAVVDMGLAGLRFDPHAWRALVDAREPTAAELLPRVVAGLGVENPRSQPQVLAALRRLELGVSSTSAEVLEPFQGRVKAVSDLLDYRKACSFVRNSGQSVLEALARHPDGRVRGDLNQLAAPTGRMSCSGPNLLALGKSPEVRGCVLPSRGRLLVRADYKAVELRVLAQVTGDKRLCEVFQNGGDPHRATAALLARKAPEAVTGEERGRAKAVNFGFAFGMGVPRFIAYARKDFKAEFSRGEAARFKSRYLRAYRGVDRWQERTRSRMPREVRTISGRLWRFPNRREGYTNRLNHPIQGTAADGMKAALILLHRRLPALGAGLLLAVHDEVLVDAPRDVADEVRALVEASMVEGMDRYVSAVPIEVDAEQRMSWADELVAS